MASNDVITRVQNERLHAMVHTPTFLVVAGSLPGLAVATSIEAGAVIGAVSGVSIVAAALLARPLRALCGRIAHIPVALMVSATIAVLMGFAVRVFDPVLAEQMGFYVQLAAVNGCAMTFVTTESFAVAPVRRSTLGTAALAAVCTVATLVFVGFMNGMFSTGAVFGLTHYELADAPIAIFSKPAGSLLLLALVAAFVQSIENAVKASREDAAKRRGASREGGER